MIKIRCDTCNNYFEVNEDNIDKDLEFMQCPNCGTIMDNKLRSAR